MGCSSARGASASRAGRAQTCQTRVEGFARDDGVVVTASNIVCGSAGASHGTPYDATVLSDGLTLCMQDITERIEESRAALTSRLPDRSLDEIREGMDAFSGRGVALTSFGTSEAWSILLPLQPEEKLKDALEHWGPIESKTEQVDGGFKSTVKLSGLPRGSLCHDWCSNVCASREVALSNAYALALIAQRSKPEAGLPRLLEDLLTPETHLMTITEGDELNILVRDRGGWAYCQRPASGHEGWLPASHVVELATVQADHGAQNMTGMLSVLHGDVVEVVHRHYSGWSFCREWLGLGGRNSSEANRKGWVAESFLEEHAADELGQDRRERKVIALIDEALTRLILATEELKVVTQSQDGNPDYATTEWIAQGLMSEVEQIEHAISNFLGRQLKAGTYAYVTEDVNSRSSAALTLSTGDHVVVLHLEASGWAWCRVRDVAQEGWVPLQSLSPVKSKEESAGTPLPMACALLPTCAICLEPLHVDDNRLALPCAHTFHVVCVGTWLSEKAECPLCRAPVLGNQTRQTCFASNSSRQIRARTIIRQTPARSTSLLQRLELSLPRRRRRS